MSIPVSLVNITSGYNLSRLNVNFDNIQQALADGLSRSGNTPNHMNADIDMNGHTLLNLPTPVNPNDPVRFQDVGNAASDAAAAAASAAEALVSETNAAGSATTALDAATAAGAGVQSVSWNFDSSTTEEDPGTGNIRLNNTLLAAVNSIYIDRIASDGSDVIDYVSSWGDSTNSVKGTLLVRKVGDPDFYLSFNITAPVINNTSWAEITVQFVDGNLSGLSDGDRVFLHFSRAGDAGVSGGGTGDLVSTNNLSDVANVATARTNLGLGSLATSSSVSTAQINNEAVTFGKMADGTTGTLITYDASSRPEEVPVGTATQVLTSNGSGATPTFQDLPPTASLLKSYGYSEISAVRDSNDVIPYDNTLPTSSEGELLLSVTVTTEEDTDVVELIFNAPFVSSSVASTPVVFTLFRGTTRVGGTMSIQSDGNDNVGSPASMLIHNTPGSAGTYTYTVRFGPTTSSTAYVNGNDTGTAFFGGLIKSTLRANVLGA